MMANMDSGFKFASIHVRLPQQLTKCPEEGSIFKWMTNKKTTLKQGRPLK